MASIDKLSVRGIRAFSPNDEEQVISFCFPLTIIVGANGCGKTTIIEALKYAVTGSLPPGNNSGHSFVHDPKSMGQTQVKAAVKLRFTNRAGKSMVVIRSMELTQKKTVMQFKNLDGVIRTTDDMGNKQALSHKCSELDRQIPQLLGVSKAVLDSVVFCHQEESSWPLQEGRVLKTKFDGIFDSTRYVKALEELKDQKKIYNSQGKDLKAELNLLKGHKHASLGFRQEQDKCRQDLSDVVDEIHEFSSKISQQEDKMEEWQQTMNSVISIDQEIDDKKAEMDQEEAKIEIQRNNIKTDYTVPENGDMNRTQLETMLAGFDKTMDSDKQHLQELEGRMAGMKQRIEQLHQQKIGFMQEKGELQGEKNRHEANLKKRVEMMEDLANTYGLELTFTQSQQSLGGGTTQMTSTGEMSTQQSRFSTIDDDAAMPGMGMHDMTDGMSVMSAMNVNITAEDLQAFGKSVQNKRTMLQDQLDGHRVQSQREEDRIAADYTTLSAKVRQVEMDISRLNQERKEAMHEVRNMKRNARSGSRITKNDIAEARKQAKKYADARDELLNSTRGTEISREIKDSQEKMGKLQKKIDNGKKILQELRKCAEINNSIEIFEKQVRNEKELIEQTKNDNSALLSQFNMMNIPTEILDGNYETQNQLNDTMDTYVAEVGDKLDTATRESDEASSQLQKLGNSVSKLSGMVDHNRSNLMDLKEQLTMLSGDGRGVQKIKYTIRQIRTYEQQNFGTTIPTNIEPQQLIAHCTQKMDESTAESDQPESIERIMKKLMKLARKRDASGEVVELVCPCCTRGFANGEEQDTFVNQLQMLGDQQRSEIVKMDKQRAERSKAARDSYTTWRNVVSSSASDWSNHKRISAEVESLQRTIQEQDEELKQAEEERDTARERLDTAKGDHFELQQLQDVIRRLNDDVSKLSAKMKEVEEKKAELSMEAPSVEGKDLNSTENELNRASDEKDRLVRAITDLNEESQKHTEKIQKESAKASKAEKLARDKEEEHAKDAKLTTRTNELNEIIANRKERGDKLTDQITPSKQKLKQKETEKNRYRKVAKDEENRRASLLNNFNNDAEKVNVVSTEIDQWMSSNNPRRLEKLDSEVETIAEEITEFDTELNSKEPEKEMLKSRVADKEAAKRDVEGNIAVLEMTDRVELLEDEIHILEEKKGKLGGDDARAKFNEAQRRINSYENERNRRTGSKDALMVQQRELLRKLDTREYKDIDERHRVKMIETETCIMAVSDLDIYYNALDSALLRFHGTKIEGINKIIKELWALTYRGEDITSIRITSDQEKSNKAKKSYNYRVVMTKGTTELDMSS